MKKMNKKEYKTPVLDVFSVCLDANTPVAVSGTGSLGNFTDGGVLE